MSQRTKTTADSAAGTIFNKIFSFFGDKWTKFAFSFMSVGYLLFLVWVAWLTFAHYFVYENAAALFVLYAFINVIFMIVTIYTRKCIITQIVSFFFHPIILVMLIYGFGNWYLILPVFIVSAVAFLVSRANESIKIIFGTIYLILFVLAVLSYITLENINIKIPYKMDFRLRNYPQTVEIEDRRTTDEPNPFRLVAYIDPDSKSNRRANFYIEKADLDKSLWNLTCERVYGGVRAPAALVYCENVFGGDGEPSYELKWFLTDDSSILNYNGQLIEINEDGEWVVVGVEDEDGDIDSDVIPDITRKDE